MIRYDAVIGPFFMIENPAKTECRLALLNTNTHLTSGVKYGADFLIYLGDPKIVHSSFTLNTDRPISFKLLAGLVRVSSSTKKDTVLYTQDKTAPFLKFSRFFL
ncbi:hypothetical protein NEHOM01_1522 [Nematocida homosporus]|uniref:uncharacterized protein n=1 Tax=Nematocida homosporus TaxID=1912981 RepID=UPI00221E8910|nr:uncharacterized protein NEHOM01_1522 [Nematocida homosporus]KAI5186522.1 hypothetical protein NEHOM01_1522 [Nematocida homosporus]